MNLTDAVDDFLRVKRREGLSPTTINGYRKSLLKFQSTSKTQAVEELDRKDYEAFLDDCMDRGLTKDTVAHYYRELKVFARWCHEEQLVGSNAFARIKTPRLDARLKTNLLTRKDFDAMVATCDAKNIIGRRDIAILHFLYETGVRVSEICSMAAEDVDLDLGRAKVWGKGSKERFVFFGNPTALAMQRYRMKLKHYREPMMFFVTRDLQPMVGNTVAQMLIRRAAKAGVTADVNPHAFRHAFATSYLRSGGDLHSLQRILGHASLAIVTRYLSLVTDDLALKHGKFGPLSPTPR